MRGKPWIPVLEDAHVEPLESHVPHLMYPHPSLAACCVQSRPHGDPAAHRHPGPDANANAHYHPYANSHAHPYASPYADTNIDADARADANPGFDSPGDPGIHDGAAVQLDRHGHVSGSH